MKAMPVHARRAGRGSIAAFLLLALALYTAAAVVAERAVGRQGDGPFRTLMEAQGTRADLVVIGDSHALPLAYAGLPARRAEEAGQHMLVLAEVGAGPLYGLFVARQALHDVAPRRVLYVLDPFGFFSDTWNRDRIADRGLLRKTPLRPSTAAILVDLVRQEDVSPWALADYLTAFSKLNAPDRFPQPGWAGEAGFDRQFRPSRHAIDARVAYLYPDGTADAADRLGLLETMIRETRAAGARFEILRLPVSEPFRAALPEVPGFEAALAERLAALHVPVHDLRAEIGDPALFFDTDHLNRDGVEALYRGGLKAVLTSEAAR